jgi:2-oxoisovalerate dehydrogenase E1 component
MTLSPEAPLPHPDRHSSLDLTGEDVLSMYRTILLTRRLDQKIWNLNRQGKAAFVVSGQGHEGAQVGSAYALEKGTDVVLPYYRDLGVVLTFGMTPAEVMMAVFARASDPSSGGRQMPNHWGCRRLGIISGSSPIATQIPHAAGIGLSRKLRGRDGVALVYFGEGATAKGDFHEALNWAGIHKLPVVFFCENNGYAISVPLEKESAVENIADRAHAYGMPGVIVDGNDALDVYGATHYALSRARRGEGPTLLEAKTYRFLAHTSDDDDRAYRSPAEVEAWRKKDPLIRIKQYLIECRLLPEEMERKLETEVASEVEQAVSEAEAASQADPGDAFVRVYAAPLRAHGERCRPRVGESPRPAEEQDVVGDEVNIIQAVNTTLDLAMQADDRVFVLGEDVGTRGGVFRATEGLLSKYGEARVFDTPLAESSIIGVAIGAALDGLRPIAEIQFADFIHSAVDQLVSEAAKLHYRSNGDFSCPLVVRVPYGGGVHGALYHSQCLEALFAHIPGLKVVCPTTPADVKGLLLSALDDPDPVIFFEHKRSYRAVKGPLPAGDFRIEIGRASVARRGRDLTVVAYGMMRHLAIEAAEALAGEGIEAEVIDLRSLAPIDREGIGESVRRTGRLLVAHEDNLSLGAGAEVAATIAEDCFYDLDAPIVRVTLADIPAVPFASTLEQAALPDTKDLVEAMRRLASL